MTTETNFATFIAGTLAYYDTFSGLIPCKVVAVLKDCNGRLIGRDELTIKLTATRGAYKRGEVLTVSASIAPPRSMVRVCGGKYRVCVCYAYAR